MELVVSNEHHFVCDNNGNPASVDGLHGYAFWQRYLPTFSQVTVVGRLSTKSIRNSVAVDGPNVRFIPLTDYPNLAGFVQHRSKLICQIRDACSSEAAYLLRVPGAIGELFRRQLRRMSRPFAVEVIGDPYESFAPGASTLRLRPFYRWLVSRQLRKQCDQATTTSYVTSRALQRSYPPSPGGFTTNFSSVSMPNEAYSAKSRQYGNRTFNHRIIVVAGLATPRKGVDLLIAAVSRLASQGRTVTLTVVGDGRLRSQLESQAAQSDAADRIDFLGSLPAGQPIREQLDRADLFVLPSHGEGLPRSIIEAMARGLPCVATTVAGISELLNESELIRPGNVNELVRVIDQVLDNPERMTRLSAQNLRRSREYHHRILQARRDRFYRHLHDVTEQHFSATSSSDHHQITASPTHSRLVPRDHQAA